MRAQSRKVGEGARKFGLDFRMQDRPKLFLFKFPGPHLLVAEQAHFGDEAEGVVFILSTLSGSKANSLPQRL